MSTQIHLVDKLTNLLKVVSSYSFTCITRPLKSSNKNLMSFQNKKKTKHQCSQHGKLNKKK